MKKFFISLALLCCSTLSAQTKIPLGDITPAIPPFISADPGATTLYPYWNDTTNQMEWLSAAAYRAAISAETSGAAGSAQTFAINRANHTGTQTGVIPTDGGGRTVAPYSMPALAIDITKEDNVYNSATGQIFTFSAARTTGQRWGARIKNTSGATITHTIPSSYSRFRNADISSLKVAAGQELRLSWLYDGTRDEIDGDPALSTLDLTEDTTPDPTSVVEIQNTDGTYNRVPVANLAGSAYTAENARDDVGAALGDTNTIDITLNDGADTIGIDVKQQQSITSDASGLKLAGDAGTPGNTKYYGTNGGGTKGWYGLPTEFLVALGDETTALTTGTAKVTFRAPYALTLSEIRTSLTTASSSGLPTINIKEGGVTIFSTKPTIDASEKTSTTAATASVLSDTAIADDAEITIDIDVAGTGAAGLKVLFKGSR